ncbi:DUF2489 domain-containing protein [Hahella aquimaris]|uniref:DUF2489 domain-containing protein n=1 Tax=Hahella sp. HNIBRBA332 TaxID=3015983 RepID=UPI00273BFB53|nr:DUF2489 domain-containing protein [Hahella sp. HNIBRBA332]WLQ13721.1 DUF2489 domain-containing protein [Hahella sp. HNIBRBA332]
MPAYLQWILILVGLAACLFLGFFIRRQLRILQEHRQLEAEQQTRTEANRAHAIESITVLARCILSDQVELSEGSIRIKVLLDAVDPSLHEQEPYAIFSKIYRETEHMPTHGARKQVDKRFLFKLDKQRWDLEEKYREQIIDASKAILEHSF